jgi:transcriptional regulator GlxA family with amidase domain
VGFNGDLPHRWMSDNAFALKGSKPIVEDPKLFEAQFERFLRTSHRTPTENSEELSWQTIGLLSHFLIDPNKESTARERGLRDIVSVAIEYIWNHTHAALAVTDIARHVGCSRRTLETHFKETTGKTVLEEIQSCRADRARHLLESTDLPVKQVVFRSGFQSHEQMRKAFQKLFGGSPGELRKRSASGSAT